MRWFLLFLAFLILAPVLVLATPWGLGAAAGLAMRFVPGLEIEGVSGPLPSRLSVEHVRMRDAEGVWLEVQDASLDLRWQALFERRVHLQSVRAARIALHRLPPGSDAPAEPAPMGLPQWPSLPVAIRIDALNLERVELGEALAGQAAALSVQGNAALADGRLEARLAARRLDQPGAADLTLALGAGTLAATLEASEPAGGMVARLADQADAPFAARLHLSGPADGAEWRLTASLGDAAARLGGRLAVSPGGEVALTLAGDLAPGPLLPENLRPLAGEIRPDLALRRAADGALTAERLTLAMPGLRLDGSAAITAAEALSGRFSAQPGAAELFAGLLPAGFGWGAIRIEGDLGGSIAAPEIGLRAVVESFRGDDVAAGLLGESATLEARLRGADRHIDARLAGQRVTATLTGPLTPPLDLAFTAELRDAVDTTGTVTAEGRLRGSFEAPSFEARLATTRLQAQGRLLEAFRATASGDLSRVEASAAGRLDGQPLDLTFAAAVAGDALRVERLSGSWAGISAEGQASGALPTGPFAGSLRITAPDLAPLRVGIGGRLIAELDATIVEGASGWAAQGIRLRLNGTGIGTPGNRAAVEAEATGSLAALDFRAGLTLPQGSVDLAGNLNQADGTLITLTRLETRAADEALRLTAPARIRVAPSGEITLEPARLISRRGGTLALEGRLRGETLAGRATLAAIPLGPISGGVVAGTLSGTVTASGATAAPEVEATLRIEGLRPTDPALASLPAARISTTARLLGKALQTQTRIEAGAGVQLNLDLAQPRGLGLEAPFEAALRGRADLGQLARPFLAAGADRVAGRLTLDLRASGTPAAPVLAGGATLAGGSYANPVYGVRLDGIAAQLSAQGERLVIDSLTGRTAGGGRVAAQGWIEPLGENLPAELRLTATAARPVVSELAEATLGADLTLRGPLLAGGSLAGRITVTRAEIRIPETLGGAVPSLGRVREVGPLPPGRRPPAPPPPPSATPGLPLALDLTIAAPRAVFVRGRGLEAELGGELRVQGTLAEPVPSGALRLRRGSFDLVGRQLQFSRGVIAFDTGTLNPTLDFLATARGRSHTINLAVKGSPAAPEVTVTAEPDLPQDEALARLLFDRETSRLSPFELASIAQAVAQLAGLTPADSGVLARLRGAAGLDRLGVVGDGSRGAAVEAGRYVAPGVYVGVRQGTSGAAPGVGVQVEITPRLRLEGETSTGPAGDRLGITWEYEY